MHEFNQSLDAVQKQQEARMKLGGAAAQLARERRKDVIALIKVCLPAGRCSGRAGQGET